MYSTLKTSLLVLFLCYSQTLLWIIHWSLSTLSCSTLHFFSFPDSLFYCRGRLFQEERPVWHTINCNVLPKDYKEMNVQQESFGGEQIRMVTELEYPHTFDSEEYAT